MGAFQDAEMLAAAKAVYEQSFIDDGLFVEDGPDAWEQQTVAVQMRWRNAFLAGLQKLGLERPVRTQTRAVRKERDS